MQDCRSGSGTHLPDIAPRDLHSVGSFKAAKSSSNDDPMATKRVTPASTLKALKEAIFGKAPSPSPREKAKNSEAVADPKAGAGGVHREPTPPKPAKDEGGGHAERGTQSDRGSAKSLPAPRPPHRSPLNSPRPVPRPTSDMEDMMSAYADFDLSSQEQCSPRGGTAHGGPRQPSAGPPASPRAAAAAAAAAFAPHPKSPLSMPVSREGMAPMSPLAAVLGEPRMRTASENGQQKVGPGPGGGIS